MNIKFFLRWFFSVAMSFFHLVALPLAAYDDFGFGDQLDHSGYAFNQREQTLECIQAPTKRWGSSGLKPVPS